MSSIAEFYLLEKSNLDEEVDLETDAEKLSDFEWPGHVFLVVLAFLDDHGINLMDGEYSDLSDSMSDEQEFTVFIFTFDQKKECAQKLSAANFNKQELKEFTQDAMEIDDEEASKVVEAEIAAIEVLRKNLDLLVDDEHVLILTID